MRLEQRKERFTYFSDGNWILVQGMMSLTLIYFQLQEDELRDAVLLLFANKQDLPNAMAISEMTDKLGLQSLRNRTVSAHSAGGGRWSGLH